MSYYVVEFKASVEYEANSFGDALDAFDECSLVDIHGEIVDMQIDILNIKKCD